MTDKILQQAVQTHRLTREEITHLLTRQDATPLLKAADEVRRKFVGDGVYLRGLIEISNYCKNNCLYCGIRAANTHVMRYRLTPVQIVQTAQAAVSYGYKTVVLPSGEDIWFDTD